jgi:hypothetical protein
MDMRSGLINPTKKKYRTLHTASSLTHNGVLKLCSFFTIYWYIRAKKQSLSDNLHGET